MELVRRPGRCSCLRAAPARRPPRNRVAFGAADSNHSSDTERERFT